MRACWLILASCILFVTQIWAADKRPILLSDEQQSYFQELIRTVQSEKIYKEIGWKNRLFYTSSRLGFEESLIDDREYFFADNGKKNLQSEMLASLSAFLNYGKVKVKLKNEHPRCLFPARWHWLKKRLKINESKIINIQCTNVDQFLMFTKYSGASLVFTNYFIDSPGSMFGHTFLKLSRKENSGVTKGGLLDDAANFTAMVPFFNPVTYPFKGLLGYFRGQFSVVPYFQKVQEYNNHEQRDLWEYNLNLTEDEIYDLTLMIYEIGFFYLDYYYLDDNCSFIILAVLDAIRPSLNLSSQYHLYAIPADTLKSVTDSPGLVSDIQYKPSAFTRYINRLQFLTDAEKELFKKVNSENSIDILDMDKSCNESCRAKVLDAFIEYIDFQEKLVGTLEPIKYKDLRRKVLIARSQNPQAVEVYNIVPEDERPDRGHTSSTVGASIGASENGKSVARFQWKPALHDQFASDLGYSDQMRIAFLDVNATWLEEREKVYFNNINYLQLTSLPKNYLLFNPWAWKFSLSSQSQFVDIEADEFFTKHYVSFGKGKSFRFLSDKLLVYALANLEGGRGSANYFGWYVGLTPELGINYNINDEFKLAFNYTYNYSWGESQEFEFNLGQLRLNYYPVKNNEVFSSVRLESKALIYDLGVRFYY